MTALQTPTPAPLLAVDPPVAHQGLCDQARWMLRCLMKMAWLMCWPRKHESDQVSPKRGGVQELQLHHSERLLTVMSALRVEQPQQ